ncbi:MULTISPECIES: hypothetical protein [unclassified Okeania]|uniref:hypothetical protein n=1 Tax=unclassified Okeania TaxID=2634635 RepID=UPI0013B8A949|nr:MULTISPECIES: hypothetical protein [unclassified Okeania]NES78292.1 hypothetical protein [Okeania sp. SIO1H4]NET21631.1 hypothetical protein [Okeania sp. SIO1H5]NET94980.1 hypothetical protein [Okeania sp. SIO1H2]
MSDNYDILTGLALSPDVTYGYDNSIAPEVQALFKNTFNYIENRTYLDFQQVDYNTAEIKINSDIFLADELVSTENQNWVQSFISQKVEYALDLNHTVRQDSVVSEVVDDVNSLHLFPTAFDLWAIETNYIVSQI